MIRLYDINNYDLLDDVSGHEDGVCKFNLINLKIRICWRNVVFSIF